MKSYAPALLAILSMAAFSMSTFVGCGGGLPLTQCSPDCAAGMHCDGNTCVLDGAPADMAVVTMPPDLWLACNPPCSGGKPHCDTGNHVCVVCTSDEECPFGQLCKGSGASTVCVPGCKSDSRCQPDGGTGMACCGGSCLDTRSDSANCGGCGVNCAPAHAGAMCAAGVCANGPCLAGWADCNKDPKDGCEVNLGTDIANCGACSKTCNLAHAIAGCAHGCYLAACNYGYDNCDGDDNNGCETSVLSDPKHCGSCATTCPAIPHSVVGCLLASCAVTKCDPGYADCDLQAANGCETSLYTDGKNCGACGNACPQGLMCTNGGCTCLNCMIPNSKTMCVNLMCQFVSCLAGYGDCNNNTKDGCEVSLIGDANNCGACGNVCPNNMAFCVSGVCTTINTKIMLIGASQPAWVQEVATNLKATGAFLAVDVTQGDQITPSLQTLMPYGALLVFSDSSFKDSAALGNVVADYYDAGGQVVIATFANASVAITGRFGTVGNGYMLIQPSGQEEPNDSLGQIIEQQSPLVVGVAKLSATAAYRSTGGAINGGVVVAQWTSGKPLIVRGVVKGRNRADVNMYPPSVGSRNDFWSGDGTNIMKNALLYR